MPGPLAGIRILEIGGIGPAPFCGMMLADAGAQLIRIDRPGGESMRDAATDILSRGRSRIMLDFKNPDHVAELRSLCGDADGLIEGFRPGVMERLSLGPDVLMADNPKLVYGRMTGWGQDGPEATTVGHDINYLALAGVLHGLGRAGEKPTPPANLVGDFGGGGMMLAFGMCAALLAVARGGQGTVIDCAMVDGAAIQAALLWSLKAEGRWRDERGTNLLDTGAPFYDTYETADGRFIAVGALEPSFYAALVRTLGLADDPAFAHQMDEATWPAMRAALEAAFRVRTRDDWTAIFAGTDACVSPVLTMDEARHHPHNVARRTFIEEGGIAQPAPAPRFGGGAP